MTDILTYHDDFVGDPEFSASAQTGTAWRIADTSSSGTPTYVTSDEPCGALAVTLASTAEVENVCVYHGDKLHFDIDDVIDFECRVKMNAATLDSTTTFTWGLTAARNDDADATAANAQFKIVGNNTVVAETDDGTTDNDDKATGKTLVNAYKKFVISFAAGKSDVRFFINGERVAAGTTFSMAAYSGLLQPNFQISKTSDTNTDGFVVDYVTVRSRRPQ